MAIQWSADQEWKAEEERIRTAIAEDKRRIAEGVEKEIAVAADRARHELKTQAANLAVTLQPEPSKWISPLIRPSSAT